MAGAVAIGAAIAGTVASTVVGANSAKKAERRARSDKNRLMDELEELESLSSQWNKSVLSTA